MKRFAPLILIAGMLLAGTVFAKSYSLGSTGFDFSGDFAFTMRELDKHSDVNINNRGDDPFHTYRVRSFINKQWTEDMGLAIEFLWDDQAAPRVQGAYFTFENIAVQNLTAKVGLIPSPFGNYGWRSTYFNQNPLIGVPVMWHYHTPFPKDGSATNETLRSAYRPLWQRSGITPAYDACWDTGIWLQYTPGIFETGFALTQGSLANTRAYDNDGYQLIGNLGLHPTNGLRFGGSVAWGPWLYGTPTPAGLTDAVANPPNRSVDPVEDYMQTAFGAYLEYSFGHFQFFSEGMSMTLETPYVYEGEVGLMTGYGELRWNFTPGWYLAGRYDGLIYSEIARFNDGTGSKDAWGDDLHRAEVAVGYRVIREGYIRLDYQRTMFFDSDIDPIEILALQWFFAF
ncbi:hypothetical protein KQI63_13600 [bacterium]|nr:hypothetical protein [bacterium]